MADEKPLIKKNLQKKLVEEKKELKGVAPKKRRAYDGEFNDQLLQIRLYKQHDELVKNGLGAIQVQDDAAVFEFSKKAKKFSPRLERRENFVRKKITELQAFENRYENLRTTIEQKGEKTKEDRIEERKIKRKLKRLDYYRKELTAISGQNASKTYWMNYIKKSGNKIKLTKEDLKKAKAS